VLTEDPEVVYFVGKQYRVFILALEETAITTPIALKQRALHLLKHREMK
jgi:hypothetical protein